MAKEQDPQYSQLELDLMHDAVNRLGTWMQDTVWRAEAVNVESIVILSILVHCLSLALTRMGAKIIDTKYRARKARHEAAMQLLSIVQQQLIAELDNPPE